MLDMALKILKELTKQGYKAYIVGGFVRNYILGIESSDIDIATNAKPKEIKELFEDSCLPNDDYGSVVVIKRGIRFDITTFREETEYNDHRRPDTIQYIDDLYPDLLRRDFTINTLCMDDEGNIQDFFDAKKDLEQRVIRTVGDAYTKFSQDSLRILRAIRFATVLDFHLSEEVISAIKETKEFVRELSYTRKREELDKIFGHPNRDVGIQYLMDFGLSKELGLTGLEKALEIDVNTPIAIWYVVDPERKYPYTRNERELLDGIEKVYPLDVLDPMTLYQYGLYVSSCVGHMRGIDLKSINEKYSQLPIKSRDDIDIQSQDIMEILDKEPGSYLRDIYDALEREILYGRLNNQKEDIINYLRKHYS